MDTDEELVKRALKGGNHHYGVLVQRYADYLFGLGMRLTAVIENLLRISLSKVFSSLIVTLKALILVRPISIG